jgi:hypothetical protein
MLIPPRIDGLLWRIPDTAIAKSEGSRRKPKRVVSEASRISDPGSFVALVVAAALSERGRIAATQERLGHSTIRMTFDPTDIFFRR